MPNPGKPNQKNFKEDIDKYFRRVILRSHFGNEPPKEPDGLLPNGNSSWIPKTIHHTVKTYIQKVQNDLSEYKTPVMHDRPNLTKGEKEALKALSDRDDIIISKADKGAA